MALTIPLHCEKFGFLSHTLTRTCKRVSFHDLYHRPPVITQPRIRDSKQSPVTQRHNKAIQTKVIRKKWKNHSTKDFIIWQQTPRVFHSRNMACRTHKKRGVWMCGIIFNTFCLVSSVVIVTINRSKWTPEFPLKRHLVSKHLSLASETTDTKDILKGFIDNCQRCRKVAYWQMLH